jgi:hypothetical protein
VPVGVVRPDPDEPDPRGELAVELRVLVRRPVVGHLDDVDGTRRQPSGATDPALRRLPQVAEEHPGQARGARLPRCRSRHEHDARVVAGVTGSGRRPDHPPGERPEPASGAVVGLSDVDAGNLQLLDDPPVRRAADGTDQGGVDDAGHRSHGADVVAVEVRQDEQIDPGDPEQVQARPEPSLVVAGVHEGDGVVAPEQHGVALPDVARGDRPVARHRPPDHEHRHGDRCDADHDHHPRGEQQPDPDRPRNQDRGREARADQHGGDDADGAARPGRRGVRQRGGRVRDAPDGSGGHPRDRGEHRGAVGPQRRDDTGAETDHRDDRCQGLRQ